MHLGLQHLLNVIPFIADLSEDDAKFILYDTDTTDDMAWVYIYSIRPESIRNGSPIYGTIHYLYFKDGMPHRGNIQYIENLDFARIGWKNLMDGGYKRLDHEEVQKYTSPVEPSDKVVQWVMA
jgi:hypothetical protein